MKYIVAIIKPFQLDDVRDALIDIGVVGMTVSDVRGYGRQKGHLSLGGGREKTVNFVPKLKIEVVVDDGFEAEAIAAIAGAAKTGQIGDGKIFVLDLARAVRIRTGEIGHAAL
jgi:nitrogen regulatory protein P-II 2